MQRIDAVLSCCTFLHLMLHRYYRKIGAYLGMLAIVLSIAAPVISQELRAWQGGVPAWDSAFCSANPNTASPASPPDREPHPVHLDACAYCGFAAHLVGLPSSAPLAILLLETRWFASPRLAAAFRPYTVVTPAQPRAPPSLT